MKIQNMDKRPGYFFKASIAEKKIEINCYYKKIFFTCRDYLAQFDKPDFVVETSLSEITSEWMNKNDFGDKYINSNEHDTGISTDFVDAEVTLVFRKIAETMVNYGVLLLHGAAIAVNNRCYIFMAPSGTGKTTHIQNWLKVVPDAFVVNGDKPFIDVINKIAYGTPWCGKENLNTNIGVPLAGLVILERSSINIIKRIDYKEMLLDLLQQCYIPKDWDLALNTYRLIGCLKDVPCYRLSCNMREESAIMAYKELYKV